MARRGDPAPMTSATPLDRARTLVDRLDLGELPASVFPPGRNENHAGTTSSGRRVFVKCLSGDRPGTVRRFGRLRAFEQTFAARGRAAGLATPACLGWDDETFVVACEWLEGARSGHDLAAADDFDDELAHAAGRMIGTLHSLPPARTPAPDTDHPAASRPLTPG